MDQSRKHTHEKNISNNPPPLETASSSIANQQEQPAPLCPISPTPLFGSSPQTHSFKEPLWQNIAKFKQKGIFASTKVEKEAPFLAILPQETDQIPENNVVPSRESQSTQSLPKKPQNTTERNCTAQQKIPKQEESVESKRESVESKRDGVESKRESVEARIANKFEQFVKKELEQQIGKRSQIQKSKQGQIFHFAYDLLQTNPQQILSIGRHRLYFPYPPYAVQQRYMQEVLSALNSSSHALLESPTGTGKTICLLSAVLGWAEEQFNRTGKKHKIIYLSRTHFQLKQIQKQLKKTCLRPTMGLFASRDMLCTKPQFAELKGKDIVEACTKAVTVSKKMRRRLHSDQSADEDKQLLQDACVFYKEREYNLNISKRYLSNKLLTLDSIRAAGSQHEFCPYYYPHQAKQNINLFLMPYNYLLDSFLLPSYADVIEDSVIIFDEAHNVAESACQGRSVLMSSRHLEAAIEELKRVLNLRRSSAELMELKQVYEADLKGLLSKFEDSLETISAFFKSVVFPRIFQGQEYSVRVTERHRTEETLYELFYEPIKDHLRSAMKNPIEKSKMIQRLLSVIEVPSLFGSSLLESLKEVPDRGFQNIEKVIVFFMKIVSLLKQKDSDQKEINHFRIVLRSAEQSSHFQLQLRCLVPCFTFQELLKYKPRNILLTSGTLAPLQFWEKQLNVPFKNQLSNKHAIDLTQVQTAIIKRGEKKVELNFSYDNMQNNGAKVITEMLQVLIRICRIVPNGILVICPSHRLLIDIQRCLSQSGLYKQLAQTKQIFFEQRKNDLYLQNFKRSACQKGGVLFCVCRGKASEGIDFTDELCRAVVMVGVPYPNISDPLMKEKKQHLDNMARGDSGSLGGEEWYFQNTIRAINQSLGRSIRHQKDYGALFLLDSRYESKRFLNSLPEWVSSSLRVINSLEEQLESDLRNFFTKMEKKFADQYQKRRKSIQAPPEKNKVNAFDIMKSKKKTRYFGVKRKNDIFF